MSAPRTSALVLLAVLFVTGALWRIAPHASRVVDVVGLLGAGLAAGFLMGVVVTRRRTS